MQNIKLTFNILHLTGIFLILKCMPFNVTEIKCYSSFKGFVIDSLNLFVKYIEINSQLF